MEFRLRSVILQFSRAPADLEPWVLGFAERSDAAACPLSRELPIPNPMIQFMLGGAYVVDGEAVPPAALWGATARPATSRTDAAARVFMVMLTGRGATALGRCDLAVLMDQRVDVMALGARTWRDMPDRIGEAAGFEARTALATEHLRNLFSRPAPRGGAILVLADAIMRHRLRGTVATVADHAELGVRGLHKAFGREIGCAPKRLLRIARLQRVLRALHPRPWSPEPPEDALLEYADQAHLDRDFLDLTSLTRSSYVAAKRARGDQLVHTLV